MKIMHWSDSYYPGPTVGGSPIFVNNLTREQRNNGHELMIVTESYPGGNKYDDYEGVKVYRYPFTPVALSGDLNEIRRLSIAAGNIKKEFQPDVIHVHLNQLTAWFDILSKNDCNFPSVITVHPPIRMTYLAESMLKRILMENDMVVAVSQSQKDDIDQFLGITSKTRLIYNGVPIVKTSVLPLSFHPTTILCIGRLHETKGFEFAIRACAKVLDMLPDAIRVIVAGDGPERKNLIDLAHKLKITQKQLEFRGWVDPDHVSDLLNESSIVIMPSVWNEPFGLVAVQAAQMGRPVIGSNIGGIPEIIVNNETGILVEPGDVDGIANAIKLLISNIAFAISLGEAAQKRAESKFSMNRCTAEYELLYKDLIYRRRKIL